MAQQVSVRFVDDVDGSEAAGTVSFGLDGREYEIDLSDGNAAALRAALAPFAAVARSAGGARRRPAAPRPGRAAGTDRERTTAIREWARENGHEVSERGRIPNAVIAAYEGRDGEAEVVPEAETAASETVEPAAPAAAEEPAPKKPRKRAVKASS